MVNLIFKQSSLIHIPMDSWIPIELNELESIPIIILMLKMFHI